MFIYNINSEENALVNEERGNNDFDAAASGIFQLTKITSLIIGEISEYLNFPKSKSIFYLLSSVDEAVFSNCRFYSFTDAQVINSTDGIFLNVSNFRVENTFAFNLLSVKNISNVNLSGVTFMNNIPNCDSKELFCSLLRLDQISNIKIQRADFSNDLDFIEKSQFPTAPLNFIAVFFSFAVQKNILFSTAEIIFTSFRYLPGRTIYLKTDNGSLLVKNLVLINEREMNKYPMLGMELIGVSFAKVESSIFKNIGNNSFLSPIRLESHPDRTR